MTDSRGPISRGIGELAQWKLVLLLALLSALLGITGASPLLPTLRVTLGETLAGDHFLRNAPTFAPTDFFDLLDQKGPALYGYRAASRWAGILGVVLQIFLAGGMVVVLGRGPFGFGQLFEPARRNFWHNIKCFFLFVVACGIALSVWLGGGFYLRNKVFEKSPPDSPVHRLSWWILALGALLIYAALSILYDFARASRRFSPTVGAWRGFRFARAAVSGSWLRALAIWLFWFVAGGVAWLALLALAWGMPAVSPPAILVMFLVLAAALAARSAARVAAWGSWIAFLEPRARRAMADTVRIRYTVARTPIAT